MRIFRKMLDDQNYKYVFRIECKESRALALEHSGLSDEFLLNEKNSDLFKISKEYAESKNTPKRIVLNSVEYPNIKTAAKMERRNENTIRKYMASIEPNKEGKYIVTMPKRN